MSLTTNYCAILTEEKPRRIFNIIKLNLATDRFSDPVLTLWQNRCDACAAFQLRMLGFNGFLPEMKSPEQVTNEMQDKGYRYDQKYFYCRKFSHEMATENEKLENAVIIFPDRTFYLQDQLKELLATKNLRPHFFIMTDSGWATDFTIKHVGTYDSGKNGIPEFRPVPMDSQCGLVIFAGDIALKQCRRAFLELCTQIDAENTTAAVIVPENFSDIDSAIDTVRAGAVAVLREDAILLNKLEQVIDYSAPFSFPNPGRVIWVQ